jgi:hypothetical protein
VWLDALGRRKDGLVAITEAVDIRRRLASIRPGVHQAELDESLRLLACYKTPETTRHRDDDQTPGVVRITRAHRHEREHTLRGMCGRRAQAG